MTMNLNHRWLGRVRRGRAKVADRLIGEAASRRVSRRDLIRGGTVVGLSAPLAGSVLTARGGGPARPAKAGASGAVTLDSDVQVAASSVLPISEGGTGQTTAPAAFKALAPTGGTASQQLLLSSSLVSEWVTAAVNAQAYGATGNGTTDDTAAIQSAVKAVSGGVIFLPPGTYKVTSTIEVPWNNILAGSGRGTVVMFSTGSASGSGSGDAFQMLGIAKPSENYSTQEDQSGGFRDLMIDGSNASTAAASTGIHIGDALGYELTNVFIRNFTQPGSIGLHVDNHQWWTEKMRARHIVTSNCTTHVLMEQTGGADSLAYSEYDIHMYIASGQTGLVIQGGVNPYANRLWLTGNVQPGAVAFLSITGTDGATTPSASKIQDSLIFMRAETSDTSGVPQPIHFGNIPPSTPLNVITNCFGEMIFEGSGSGTSWGQSNALPGNLLSFRGIINVNGDTNLVTAQGTQLVTTPALTNGSPATNTSQGNVQVIISGSGVTSIGLLQDGSTVTTGLTSGTFLLPPGGQITVNWTGSVTPSWHWLRAAT